MLIGVAVAAYAPGLHGVFVFDSVERVIRNQSLRINTEVLGIATNHRHIGDELPGLKLFHPITHFIDHAKPVGGQRQAGA